MVLGSPICFIFSRFALYFSIISFVFDICITSHRWFIG
jgi:hypothetical protein